MMLFELSTLTIMLDTSTSQLPSKAIDVVNHLYYDWPEYSIWMIMASAIFFFFVISTLFIRNKNLLFGKKDSFALGVIILLALLQIFQFYSGDSLGKRSITIPIAITIAIFSVIVLLYSTLNVFRSINIYRRLFYQALLVWIVGYWTYFLAFFQEGTYNSVAAIIIRPALSAVGMFVSYCDLQEIPDNLKIQPIYVCVFYLTNFAAIYTSFSLVLELIGDKFEAYLRLRKVCKLSNRPLFILVGVNMANLRMAQSIKTKYNNGNDCIILFLCENVRSAQNQSRFNLSYLIDILTHHKDLYSVVKKYNAVISLSEGDFCKEIETDKEGSFFQIYQLEKVELLIKQSSYVRVFFFSDMEDNNLRGAETFLLGTKQYPNIRCYVRAHDNPYNEALLLTYPEKIEIIDTSQKSIDFLKRDASCHPVSFVDIEEDCTVSSAFNSLIIGFGRTGQEALSFLYEYGAFCDSRNNYQRSPFHCMVVDKDMNQLRGSYMSSKPLLKQMSGEVDVKLNEWSSNSSGFWDWLELNVSNLNYIVVCIGDDELGISLAASIFSLAFQKKRADSKFCVFVRSYKRENVRRLKQIASYYSERYCRDMNGARIVVFGEFDSIFSYDSILDNKDKYKAQLLYNYFCQLDGNNDSWDKRHSHKKNEETYTDKKNLQRKEYLDYSSALHSITKMILFGQGHLDITIKELDSILKAIENRHGNFDKIEYVLETQLFNRKMLNLAITEHLRWIAIHEMLGYVPCEEGIYVTDIVRKKSPLMCSWELLDKKSKQVSWLVDYKYYDFLLVEASFHLYSSLDNN